MASLGSDSRQACPAAGTEERFSAERRVAPVSLSFVRTLLRPQFGDAFEFTSIQVNKNYASALHVDGNNNGASKIIGLGDFSGGGLWASGKGALDCRNKWHEFDGNLPHCTLPFTGTRYTLIYFVQVSARRSPLHCETHPPSLCRTNARVALRRSPTTRSM